ncbi:GNAT family N-acetyltransferase [Mucilaginibacter ginkgonis]|uniref:GNAT family N-acetyltransferase n=1 Tax=Mucilaginibacter ginkgonis TaxID=2682091 RepID=A0A6I4HXJ7_9SPHI|nr:GNAT family N-acetyltransferase [Mucilaginibacter ginkgonis]QQL48254.1 GNAT family N-acetyltransferase [Mucilaginibacter ginkgonis]
MHIRRATTSDITAIMLLIKKVIPLMRAAGNLQWDDNYPNPEKFALDISKNQLWVAEEDGKIAGVAALTIDQDPEYADVGWDITEPAIVTHRLAVDPDFQGRGVAAALLNIAEGIALERGFKTLRIDTNNNNKATQALFPKLGYKFCGEIGLQFRPGLRFYCYEKRLD